MLNHLIFMAFVVISFATSFHLNVKDGDSSNEVTVSLKQFEVLDFLGFGAYGMVFTAKKIGGPDDGKLYALKSTNTSHILKYHDADFLLIERNVLEQVRGLPWATGLHYAWRDGQYLFLVMDLGVGGSFISKCIGNNTFDAATTRVILSEMIVAIEALHSIGLVNTDISIKNTVIDAFGHLMLTDFGVTERLIDDNSTNLDWISFYRMFSNQIFPKTINAGNQTELNEMIKGMTDTKLPELKNHPYFDGVDWVKVAERRSDPPYKPAEFQPNIQKIQLDFWDSHKIDKDYMLDDFIIQKLRNYTYVAPEHRN